MVLPNGSNHYLNDDSSRTLQPADLVCRRKKETIGKNVTSKKKQQQQQQQQQQRQRQQSKKQTTKRRRKSVATEDDSAVGDEEEKEKETPVTDEEFLDAYHIGTVAETYHDSDSEFYEEDQVLEDNSEVLVAFQEQPSRDERWVRYKEDELYEYSESDLICCKEEDLTILDRRYFKVGDDCVKAKNTLGMCGKIVDVNVKATLFCPATKEYAHGVDSKECQTLRRVYPEATVVYGNWVGIVETVSDVIRVGLLKDIRVEASKKKIGKWLGGPSWPLAAGDAFLKRVKDREDVAHHVYLDEELPDLLVEVKTSGQSDEYTSEGEELSDEVERDWYYTNTLGLRHCDPEESDRVERFHLTSTQCGCYRPGDIVDVEQQKITRAVRQMLQRHEWNERVGYNSSGRMQEQVKRFHFLASCREKGDGDREDAFFSAFAIDNEYLQRLEPTRKYDAKMAAVCKKLVSKNHPHISMGHRAVVKSIHDGMAQVNWKMQHSYQKEGMIRNARTYKDDPLRRVAPKKLPPSLKRDYGEEDEEAEEAEGEDAALDGNPEHFLPPWCEASCELQEKPPRTLPASMLTVVDRFCDHFLQAGDHVLCCKNTLKKYFPHAHIRALRFEEKREELWANEEKKNVQNQNFYKSSLASNDEIYCTRVVSTETTCEVLWQDGSRTLEKAKDLLKMEHLEDHVYRCGDFVVKTTEFYKAVAPNKVYDLEKTWEDELMRKREQYSEKAVLNTFAVGYVEVMNSEERTADVVWIADLFVLEASEDDAKRFLHTQGKNRLPDIPTELRWREGWDDSDFSSERKPSEVCIDDGGAASFDNHYNKYYADTMDKLIGREKRSSGKNEGIKRGVVRFKSRETVPVYALQKYPSLLFQATGNEIVLRNIDGIEELFEEDEFEDLKTVPYDFNKEVSASKEPQVLDALVEQWGSNRFVHDLKNREIFNRDLAPPYALEACEHILELIHNPAKRVCRHPLCSAVKDVFVPFYDRKLQVIPGSPWSVPEHEENVYWFKGLSKVPKRLSGTSPEWQHPHGKNAALWGFAAAEAYKLRHTKRSEQKFDGRTYVSSYVQDVSWIGEIVESSAGLMKIAWGNGTNSHQPPFNIGLCELLDDSDDSDSENSDSFFSDDRPERHWIEDMDSEWDTEENTDIASDFDSENSSHSSEWETDPERERSESDDMEEEEEGESEEEDSSYDNLENDGVDRGNVVVRNDEEDGVSRARNGSGGVNIECGAGSIAVFGSLLGGPLESIRQIVEETVTNDGNLFGRDRDNVDNDGPIDADSISRQIKNALPPGLFEDHARDTAFEDIMDNCKNLGFNAQTELKKALTRYSDEELKLLIISTHFWRRNYNKDEEVLGENAEPSNLEKDFVFKVQLNAEYAASSRRSKDVAHPRNIAKAYPDIFLDAGKVRTEVFDALHDSTKRSDRDGLNAFRSLDGTNEPRNSSRVEMPSLLDSLNLVWRQERRKKVEALENHMQSLSTRKIITKNEDRAMMVDESDIDEEDEEELSTSFDIVDQGFSDFLLTDSSSQVNLPRKVQKAVQKEWSILQKGLPSNEIWVRSSATKVNVLRAMIKGPPLTPYHDGLFCFDFLFDEDYPSVPPKVHYHSYGYRLNPNLYEEGKVCLSLLNTWDSEENSERWSSSSSALQVLVSIQALVLNDKPYYNEAGYERQRGTEEGIRNSAIYSENAYLLSLKTMIQTLKRPPSGFEALVRAHFKGRRASILKGIAAYLEGAPVGSYCDDPNVKHTKHDTHNVKPTKGFLLSLQSLQETVKTALRTL
jgi:ubiquitin-protein ligase